MELTPSSVVQARADQVSAGLQDETVILELSRGVYYSVSDVGASVWKAIETPKSIQDVCDQIVETHDVDPVRCMTDVLTFVQDLVDHRLAGVIVEDP